MTEPTGSRSDRTAEFLALVTATVIIGQQVAGKAVRDALFLTEFDVKRLPLAMVAAGVLSILTAVLMSRLLARFGPLRLLPSALAVSATLYIVEWLLLSTHPLVATMLFYFHITAFSASLISGFWSIMNERFDPHAAKKTFARVAAAATLGGILGGLLVKGASAYVDVPSLLLLLSAMHAAAIPLIWGIGGPKTTSARPTIDNEIQSSIPLLRRSGYLKLMVALVTAVGVITALVDYAFKVEVSARLQESGEMAGFFAMFYSIAGILAFTLQSTLGRRSLERLGLGGTLAVLPVAVAISGMAGSILSRFWTSILMRGALATLTHTFFRSGFELLYAPLPQHIKRPTKAIIDVGADRLGDILGGGMLLALIAVIPNLSSNLVMDLAIVAAVAVLVVVIRVNHSYVEQLAESLRARPLTGLEERLGFRVRPRSEAATGGTASTMVPVTVVEKDDSGTTASGPPTQATFSPSGDTQDDTGRLLADIKILVDGGVEARREVLQRPRLDPTLIPHIIPLLNEPELAAVSTSALKQLAPRHTGALIDALLDSSLPVAIRRRIPLTLEDGADRRTIYGLVAGLDSEEFEIRYRCAQVLAQIKTRNKDLRVPRDAIFRAVRIEVERPVQAWARQTLEVDQQRGTETGHPANYRTLEYVFVLLGLVLDDEVMRLSMHALTQGDSGFRGTALEYLGQVVPDEIRLPLLGHVSPEGGPTRSRPAPDLVRDLVDRGKNLVGKAPKSTDFPVHIRGTYTVIGLSGDIDLSSSPQVRECLLKYIDHGRDVLVDMNQVSYMDSSAVASLVEGLQRARKRGVEFGLVGVSESAMRVLHLSRLDKVFPLLDSLPE